MKTLMRRVLREWERSILWASVAVFSLVAALIFSRLAGEKTASQVRQPPARSPQSFLNAKTAFDFMQPAAGSSTSARNPFAFSCRIPQPTVVAPPVVSPADPQTTPTPPPARPDAAVARAVDSNPIVTPTPPPKHTASIRYRGLYSGGRDTTRQWAFVSTRESPSEVTATAVLATGQQAAGLTVKRITPAELIVAGPTGVEVSIAVGAQVQIALD